MTFLKTIKLNNNIWLLNKSFSPLYYYTSNTNTTEDLNKFSNNTENPINTTSGTYNSSVDVNVHTDGLTVLGEGLKVIGHAIEQNAPAITAAAAGGGTAIILKTLPPKERAAAILGAGAISSGTVLASQAIKEASKHLEKSSVPDRTDNNSPDNSFINSPYENSNEFINLINKEPFFVNSPNEELEYLTHKLELIPKLESLTVGVMIINLGVLLLMVFVSLNFIVKSFKLDTREFVKSRPLLLKLVSLFLKSRELTSLFMLVFINFGLCIMFYGLSYLLHFLKLIII